MGSWEQAESALLSDSLEEFGGPVTYLPAAGDPFALAGGGIFSDRYEEVSPDTGAPISTTQPNLVVRRSAWPDSWTRDDRVQVGGDTYGPIDVREEGNHDALRVFLHLETQ